jgi:hypothetical protein
MQGLLRNGPKACRPITFIFVINHRPSTRLITEPVSNKVSGWKNPVPSCSMPMARCSTCTAWPAGRTAVPGARAGPGLLWRDKQIEYTRLVTTSSHGAHYQPFWALTRAALVYAIKRLLGPDRPPGSLDTPVERLMNQYRSLSAFPENREVLQALKARASRPAS